jgi:lipopolysaccharide transport system permease protein
MSPPLEPPISSPTQRAELPVTRIEAAKGWIPLDLRQLWEFRELLFFLAWRDVSVRYKQTVLGAAWAIIQPLFSMVVFSVFFGRLARIPSDGVPYPIFSYCALLPWTFFASVLPAAIDFAIAFVVLIGMMLWYGIVPTINIVWLPLFLLLALVAALAVGAWLSALNVAYRDVRHAITFLVQFWMYASPVVYPTSMLPERWRVLYGLNPMTGVIEGFRWALLGTGTRPGAFTAVSAAVTVLLLVSGVFYFKRMERSFADVV